LLAVAEHRQMQSEIIPRIATGFCGGLAHTGGMCGAVSGGIMAISLVLGRSSPTDQKDRCYQAERAFLRGFTAHFGELNCQKLTGVHLGTPEGQAAYKEKGLKKQCTEYVGQAVQITLEVIDHINL
jgi:C_GCAxxG_C_C family probable redox protein